MPMYEETQVRTSKDFISFLSVQMNSSPTGKTTYTKSQEYSEKENKKGQACLDNQIWQEATVVSD